MEFLWIVDAAEVPILFISGLEFGILAAAPAPGTTRLSAVAWAKAGKPVPGQATRAHTHHPCDDVDPMPDYENCLPD